MAAVSLQAERRPGASLHRIQDVTSSATSAFALLCEVEKWPVWLSILRTARRLDDGPLGIGSEVAVRSTIPGEVEELYEVDRFLDGHVLSLVGAYSLRRRIDFRVESKSTLARVTVKIDYPSYGGLVGTLVDRLTVRRRIDLALAESLVHFKGLVEFTRAEDELLADF